MKTFWTPWRIEHVTGKTESLKGCLFEPEGDFSSDKKQLLLYRDSANLVLLNRYPYANGHLLIAPARHIECLTSLEEYELSSLMYLIKEASKILKAHLHPDGLNIGCNIGATAGAGIADHLHFHIVPRWDGDHNFIAVISELRTIPEHIDQTFDQLLPYFQKLLNEDSE